MLSIAQGRNLVLGCKQLSCVVGNSMSSLDCHLFSAYWKHDYFLEFCGEVSFGNMLYFPILSVYLSYIHKNFKDSFLLVLILSNTWVFHFFSQVPISGWIINSSLIEQAFETFIAILFPSSCCLIHFLLIGFNMSVDQ